MNQQDWIDEIPPFQKHSPTSRAAATDILGDLSRLRANVMRVLILAGKRGATDEEIQQYLQMNPSTQRPRRIELMRLGLCKDSGQRRKTQSGRAATVWIAQRGMPDAKN